MGGIPDGLCELSGGATPYSPGRFLFPADPEKGGYAGILTVTAYQGILGVTVAYPRIRDAKGRLELVVDTFDSAAPVLSVAELRATTPDAPATAEYEATLLEGAVAWLGGAYAPGTTLDRVTLV